MSEGENEDPVIPPIEFVSTVQMSVDARSMYDSPRLNMIHLVGDLAVVIGGLGFGFAGYPLGFLAAIFGALFLLFSQVDVIQRWRVRHYYGSLLGRRVTIQLDEIGIRFANDLAASQLPWSTITAMRTNDRTTVFFRDRAILGYLPASAFATKEERARAIEFARNHIARASTASRG